MMPDDDGRPPALGVALLLALAMSTVYLLIVWGLVL